VNGSQPDLTFFTNDKQQTLPDRFKSTLVDTRLFDVLVGYFRSSAFYQLYESIEPIAKTRILVGIGLYEESHRAVRSYQNQAALDFDSHSNTKRRFQEILMQEVEDSPETDQNLEKGLRKFIAFLQSECPNVETDWKSGCYPGRVRPPL
jgi:hypothetical protein